MLPDENGMKQFAWVHGSEPGRYERTKTSLKDTAKGLRLSFRSGRKEPLSENWVVWKGKLQTP